MNLVLRRSRKLQSVVLSVMVAAATWLPSLVRAQIGASTLTGKVTDAATNKPISDVVVTATSPALQGEQTVVTDETGSFRIPNLPPGDYSLRYEADVYRPYEHKDIPLRSTVTLRVDAQLLPETLQAAEVEVVGKAPTIDVGSARQGVTIDQDFISRVPVAPPTGKGGANRSFEQLAEIAPGVHNDHFGASIAGTSSPENMYMIDGMTVNDPGFGYNGTPLSIDFIKETSIITGGYLPEYGRGGGGILDVVTKSGSNEFHGSVFGNVMPWTANPKFPPPQDSISTTYALDSVRDFGFDLGGPIVKDKLWFYLGADVSRLSYDLTRYLNSLQVDDEGKYAFDDQGLIRSQRIPGSRRVLLADQSSLQYIGKLTFSPTQNDRLELTHRGTPTHSGGEGKYSVDYETGLPEIWGNPGTSTIIGPYAPTAWKQVADAYDTSLRWTHSTPDKRLTFDTTLGWHHQRTADLASDGTIGGSGLSGTPLFTFQATTPIHSITDFETISNPALCMNDAPDGDPRCPTARYALGGPQILQDRRYDRYQARELVTFVTPGLGHHVMKAGAEFEYMTYSSRRGYPGVSLYEERGDGSEIRNFRNYGGLTGPDEAYDIALLKYKTYVLSFGAFAQDSWSIMDKITLNLGIRYDTQSLYADQGLGLRLPNQWSPRVGVIFDPTQQGRAKLFANYAIYYQTFPLNIMDRAGSGEPGLASLRPRSACDPRSSGYPDSCADYDNLLPVVGASGPNKKIDYLTTGKLVVDPDIKSQSTNEISGGGEYEIIPNGRISLTYIHRWMGYVIEDMSRDGGTTYFVGNPGSGIATDFPTPKRTYDAGILSFTKTFTDQWLAQASYTLSYLRGNWDGLFRPSTFQLDPGTNADFDIPAIIVNRNGPLSADRRHEIKLFLARDIELAPEHHLDLGLSFVSRSGGPTSYLGRHLVYGTDEVFILPSGSGERLPFVHRVDLHVGYTFYQTRAAKLQLTADIFNLFNFQAVTRRSETYTLRAVRAIQGDAAKKPFSDNDNKVIDPNKIVPEDGDERPFEASDRNRAFGSPEEYQEPISMRIGVKGSF